ncbi:MAG: hypothetical protein O2904_03365 [bacterium]|nr:hypothetical protein [bacterium]
MRKNLFHLSAIEKRLLHLDFNRSKDIINKAEDTDGSLTDASAESQLESHTEKMVNDISQIKIGWTAWAANFFRSGVAMDKELQAQIRERAEERIAQESDLAIGRLKGFFLRGKRRLYLESVDRIAESMRGDLSVHLQEQVQEATERAGKYNRLANLLRDKTTPLTMKPTMEKKLTESLQRIRIKFETAKPITSEKLTEGWRSELAIEEMATKELLKRNIVSPNEIDNLFQRNAEGNGALLTLMKADASLHREPALLKSLMRSVASLQRGNSRYYRLQKFMQSDPNIGDTSSRLQTLQNSPRIIGKQMKVSLGLGNVVDAYVYNRGLGFVLLKYGDKFCVLDTQASEVTYKDDAGAFHEYPLLENSLSLQF